MRHSDVHQDFRCIFDSVKTQTASELWIRSDMCGKYSSTALISSMSAYLSTVTFWAFPLVQ